MGEKRMSKEVLKVKIFRFDPSKDKEPRYQTYEVPKPQEGKLLASSVLEYIVQNLDSTVAYYWPGCLMGFCANCTVMINGKPKLLCRTTVDDEVVFEPLKGYEVIRDLVVSKTRTK